MGLIGNSTFQRIWLPGFLLQSVVIGGGYATGRELVEYFLSAGPLGGLLGMLLTAVLFSVLSALAFEFARVTRSFNYRSFFGQLLGRAWFLYEIAYFLLALLILAVIAAASGEMIGSRWGVSRAIGVVLLMLPIAILVFRGSALIEKVLAGWSFLLYAVYIALVLTYLHAFGGDLAGKFTSAPAGTAWLVKGVTYFGYNLVAVPLVLFCVPHMRTRRDAIMAGALAGPLVMLPALMIYFTMVASYPQILDAAVPADYLMQRLDLGWLDVLFYVVVFGTFVETGTALLHAVNDRIALRFENSGNAMPTWLRPVIAVSAILVSVVLAVRFGIIDLIARGYGTLTWAFILIFALPLCTIGVWMIRQRAHSEVTNADATG